MQLPAQLLLRCVTGATQVVRVPLGCNGATQLLRVPIRSYGCYSAIAGSTGATLLLQELLDAHHVLNGLFSRF